MENKPHVSPFEDVHQKVQAFKNHAREVMERDAERRERNARQDAKEAAEKKGGPLGLTRERF
jgi:hypothetical protein